MAVDLNNALKIFCLYEMIKKHSITIMKKKDLQNNICHNVDPSNDLTIIPPKLKLQAPKKTNKGPGILEIIFM